MKSLRILAPALALLAAACVSPVKVVQPLPAAVTQSPSMVADVDVTLSPLATEAMTRFEAKAAEKRAAAGLPALDPGAEPAPATSPDEYATLPFAQMFELVVADVTRQRGFSHGRPLRLAVEIDTLKTANTGMAILAASSDQLSGSVQVFDGVGGQKLGEFYVDVINSHSGLLGLALRGSGIREELAGEFAIHIARQLGGKTRR